jgi:hypothetical protein
MLIELGDASHFLFKRIFLVCASLLVKSIYVMSLMPVCCCRPIPSDLMVLQCAVCHFSDPKLVDIGAAAPEGGLCGVSTAGDVVVVMVI